MTTSTQLRRIHLDHAATTPLAPEVLEAMLPWLRAGHANPSSLHRSGQRARAAVEDARERLAAALAAHPSELVFTSGATEALALGLRGAAGDGSEGGLAVGATEHAAILATARDLERRGHALRTLAPDADGAVVPEALERALAASERPVRVVALMHTNNETGVLQDVPALAATAHRHGALLLCDAVQAFGYAPLDVRALGADLVALSAHKVRGPTGVGALWVRDGVALEPQQLGGSQERGLRAGTHHLSGIVGFGVAAERAAAGWEARAARARALRDRLEVAVTALPGVHRNGGDRRGPKHLNARFEGLDGEALLMALDDLGVEASAGSACAAGSLEPSHVLTAMGLAAPSAKASVRFSIGEEVDEADVDAAAERVALAVERCRALAA